MSKTRYRIAVEVDSDDYPSVEDVKRELGGLSAMFPGSRLRIDSCHRCPQCRSWHEQGKGKMVYVRDVDMWCSNCGSIVRSSDDIPTRGLMSACDLDGVDDRAPIRAPELEIDVDVSLVTSDSQKIPLVRITDDTLAIHSISALVAKAHQFDKHGPALVRLAMAADAIRDLVRNDK